MTSFYLPRRVRDRVGKRSRISFSRYPKPGPRTDSRETSRNVAGKGWDAPRLRGHSRRVVLHGVCLDAHDGGNVGREQAVGILCQHRVGEILNHQGHSMSPPAQQAGQQGSRLCLAGLRGDAIIPVVVKADLPSWALSSRNRGFLTEWTRIGCSSSSWEWLLNVEQHPVEPWFLMHNRSRISQTWRDPHRAVKVAVQPVPPWVARSGRPKPVGGSPRPHQVRSS